MELSAVVLTQHLRKGTFKTRILDGLLLKYVYKCFHGGVSP